jgi:hypothetical protein
MRAFQSNFHRIMPSVEQIEAARSNYQTKNLMEPMTLAIALESAPLEMDTHGVVRGETYARLDSNQRPTA